jgi:hypothetical protein
MGPGDLHARLKPSPLFGPLPPVVDEVDPEEAVTLQPPDRSCLIANA